MSIPLDKDGNPLFDPQEVRAQSGNYGDKPYNEDAE